MSLLPTAPSRCERAASPSTQSLDPDLLSGTQSTTPLSDRDATVAWPYMQDSGIVFNGKMYFAAMDGYDFYPANTLPNHGKELWVTDGTEAGTTMVRNTNTHIANSASNGHINGDLSFNQVRVCRARASRRRRSLAHRTQGPVPSLILYDTSLTVWLFLVGVVARSSL